MGSSCGGTIALTNLSNLCTYNTSMVMITPEATEPNN